MDSLVQQAEAAHRRGDLDAAKRLYTEQLAQIRNRLMRSMGWALC